MSLLKRLRRTFTFGVCASVLYGLWLILVINTSSKLWFAIEAMGYVLVMVSWSYVFCSKGSAK